MIVKFKGKEYNAYKLVDAYTLAIYDHKNKKKEVSTWDIQIFIDTLNEFRPFEQVYGEQIISDKDTKELRQV